MLRPGFGNEPRFLFELGGHPDLEVLSFSGVEHVSRLYMFDIDLVSKNQKIAFDSVVNKPAKLIIKGKLIDRYVHGVLLRCDLVNVTRRRAQYHVHLASPHARRWRGPRGRRDPDRSGNDLRHGPASPGPRARHRAAAIPRSRRSGTR